MKLKKFKGNPRTEGLYIDINRLKAEVRKAKQQRMIKGGEADLGIQALPQGEIATRTVGKYFGRPIMASPKAKEDTMLEQLPDIFKTHMKQLALQQDFDVQEHHQRLLTTGPFLEAHTRQAIWGEEAAKRLIPFEHINPEPINPANQVLLAGMPIGIGGKGNTSAAQQLKTLDEEALNPAPALVVPSNRDIEGVKKAGGATGDPLFSQEEIRRRLGPARQKQAPSDPNEGMDPELKKAMEAEDMRLKKLKIR